MDKISDFGSDDGGSIPSGATYFLMKLKLAFSGKSMWNYLTIVIKKRRIEQRPIDIYKMIISTKIFEAIIRIHFTCPYNFLPYQKF